MIRKLSIGILLLVATFIIGLIGYLIIIFAGDYVIDEKKLVMDSATSLVDTDGKLVTKLYAQNREIVSIKEVPEEVQQAFIATEDSRFYNHPGLDFQAITRALYKDVLAGSKVEGGSTITQQLAKNVFLSHDKTFLRKTKEAIISLNLERNYSKKKILEMYLNQIYFGHGAYGIQAASHLFFNKDVEDLTVEEGALLAALPKAPGSYSPIDHMDKSKERRNLVLSLMEKQGYLSAEETVRLQGKTVALNVADIGKDPAYLTYIDMVLEEAAKKYHLSNEEVLRGGYKIVIPMEERTQKAAYKLFQEAQYFPGSSNEELPEGAFVLMDSESGGVLAVQGGRNYVRRGLNHVNTKRQPGSTFKPLAVYGPALESGEYDPYSLLKDEKTDYNGYSPSNYNQTYQGEMSMYDALVHSVNAPAVWLLNELKISESKKYLDKAGLKIKDNDLKVALGGIDEGVSPMEMMKAYRAFAEEGKVIEPHFISRIYNQEGKLIGEAKGKEKKVFSKQTAWYMTKMLESVVTDGTGKQGHTDRPLAGKTGTTSYEKVKGGARDAWFVGYTPNAVGSLWMGYDRTDDSHYLTGGSSYPTKLFKDILNQMPERKQAAFKKPSGVKDLDKPIHLVKIDDLSSAFTFHYGLPAVKLTWTPSEDERLQYDIYEVKDGKAEKIDRVTGTGEYEVNSLPIFETISYYVVPYNPQTEQEGESSNEIGTRFIDKFNKSGKKKEEKGKKNKPKHKAE
ncbi:transglycosylase domain-containing protein [Pseudalkalibacillus caeni]|uniref:PBP1A family penicillin-binding protein n=1 Tax=Exobacillus caeni TaxID=2574798 RepID=A0A5R9FBY5_9BACL|nr:PBP1A family penicillin-binding protein [Pseudalkalibacillus caeni]TLS38074.1 PBP1A family penicillin-binding protein [Pseudalkalibacillus caeni]